MKDLSLSVLLAASLAASGARASVAPAAPFLHLGNYSLPVSTSSAKAQTLFDLGLMHEFGFNQVESRKAFQLAAQEDPSCAMAQWGISYSWGGFLNHLALEQQQAEVAFAASRRAQDLCTSDVPQEYDDVERRRLSPSAACTPFEAALISATVLRFPSATAARNQTSANVAYASALQAAVDSGQDFGGAKYETALRVFLAEALMNLEATNYYSSEVSSYGGV